MASSLTPLYFILLSSLLFSSFPTPSLSKSVQCNPSDYKVLMKIKQSLNNPYHLASWVPNTDCCGWYCVECNPNTNRITQLFIDTGNISGQIPAEVGDLPYLNTLIFRKLTNLTGSIPSSITKLKYLKMARLSWTNLSGPIPDFLSQIPSLEYLDLSFNQHSGSIPASLANLPNLQTLHLDRNRLTGSIPESFGRFSGKELYLFLSHNQLSGEIPRSFGDLNFINIDLSRNKLVGDASMLFKANGSTQTVDLSRNMLEFDFSKVGFQKSLIYLDISHNRIKGSIPKAITGVDLQTLNVSYNRLCGEIPSGGKMRMFETYEFFHNRCLCGAPLAKCKSGSVDGTGV